MVMLWLEGGQGEVWGACAPPPPNTPKIPNRPPRSPPPLPLLDPPSNAPPPPPRGLRPAVSWGVSWRPEPRGPPPPPGTLPHRSRAAGSRTPAMHRHTACGLWAEEHLQCIATLPGGRGQCKFCNALSHCPGVVGSGTAAMHCHPARGQWASAIPAMHCHTTRGRRAVELLQCTATLPVGSGQWNSCNAHHGHFVLMAPVRNRTRTSLKSWAPCVNAVGPL